MTVTAGVTDTDSRADLRRDACRLVDDRLSPGQKLGFVHDLLRRDMAEVRMFLDAIEKHTAALTSTGRDSPQVAAALERIAEDRATRARYLEFARDADLASVRARMLELARTLGWLSPAELREETMRMIADRLASSSVNSSEVDLVCGLNQDGGLDQHLNRLHLSTTQADKVTTAAVMACLGSGDGRARVLRALTSPNTYDVEIAQVYLRHRPFVDPSELRAATHGIARMTSAEAQVLALDALARQRLVDPDSLVELTRSFLAAKSVQVQRAIAGILIRADYGSMATPELVRTLRERRIKSPDGEDVIDVLIRRLQPR